MPPMCMQDGVSYVYAYAGYLVLICLFIVRWLGSCGVVCLVCLLNVGFVPLPGMVLLYRFKCLGSMNNRRILQRCACFAIL